MLRLLGCFTLLLLALALGALTLGAYASLNAGAPLWMRTLSLTEGVLTRGLPLAAFARGMLEALLCAACVYGAAAWPPAEKNPRLGGKRI